MPHPAQPENLGYFNFSTRHDKSASSTPPISPLATSERPRTPAVARTPPRPAIRNRPQSDYSAIRSRVKVQTIEEDVVATKAPSTPEGRAASPGRRPSTPGSAGRRTPVRFASVISRRSVHSEVAQNAPVRLGSEVGFSPPTRPQPGRTWSRSKSGSIW